MEACVYIETHVEEVAQNFECDTVHFYHDKLVVAGLLKDMQGLPTHACSTHVLTGYPP